MGFIFMDKEMMSMEIQSTVIGQLSGAMKQLQTA